METRYGIQGRQSQCCINIDRESDYVEDRTNLVVNDGTVKKLSFQLTKVT
jgi:hypothetical protein